MRAALRRAALPAAVLAAVVFALTHRVMLVGGGSMAPALEAGDVAVVQRGAAAGTGDVVLFRRRGYGFVLHRVVGVTVGGALLTRGDSNPSADRDPVSREAVEGRVVWVVRSTRASRACADGARRLGSACARILPQSHSVRR